MLTFQDLEKENKKDEFIWRVISEHKGSDLYRECVIAKEYDAHRNPTIMHYQKLLQDVGGQFLPDEYSANYKLASNFFARMKSQRVQYSFGNGVTWSGEPDPLGKDFDHQLQEAAKYAIVGGVSFGFFNLDHVEVFSVDEFAPLWDERNGSLRAGVRFWQIADGKPVRATLYEEDGYTEYLKEDGKVSILKEKSPYIVQTAETAVDDPEIIGGKNYPTFPIVPFWANEYKQSELVGVREQIDCYDLVKSGFANNIDEASYIYWAIQNAGGMDEIDLATFLQRMRTLHAAIVEDGGAKAEAHTLDVPVEGRERLLDRLRADIYEDFMLLDTKNIAGGAITATQIQAGYEPMNMKADEFEYFALQFIDGLKAVAGVEDEATFTRSRLVNQTEEIQAVLQSAQFLDDDYVMRKVLTILGDGDKYEEMLAKIDEQDFEQMRADDETT